ncbi:solute symporter family protein [Actinoplanes xinjiangensis]|uniref:Cation/acetate symporter n=1 Tax=Actinoplanes xinjiangensis TaxID=512350 RepID=A0A316ETK9_9ACTN|nr:cation acetate symporter [Actinoplanes xinjiangensis]PWK36067.1 cation/acetate symporter [Actinoplanes xinjiangensis]GIF42931.1 cation acetate symporter [Actinoplanes xinjiangensis]
MIFSLIIFFLVSRLGRARDTCSDFYTADRAFTAPQNGFALFGTFMMMTSFLAAGDQVALNGYDGVLVIAALVLSWGVALLLVAEPLRNTGTYTLGDTLSVRMRHRSVRLAAATVTLVVFFCFMTAQLVSAGRLLAQMLHLPSPIGPLLVIIAIGGLTVMTVWYGGMRGTTWTQILNAVLLFAVVIVLAGILLARHRYDISELLGAAAAARPGDDILAPGLRFGADTHPLDFVSHLLTTVLGYAALPYLFIRYLTVPSAVHARRSVSWTIWLITPFYLLLILIGFGATALITTEQNLPGAGQHRSAVPLLAAHLGGVPLLAFTASVIFTTMIAVAAGLTTSAAANFTRDMYPTVARRKPLDEASEVKVARRTVVVLCIAQTLCAVLLLGHSIEFLLSLDVTLVASSMLPPLLFSWFWRRFNTAGALWSMYGGAAVTVILVAVSPTVSGGPSALFPDADFAYFPWRSVGLVSIPAGFLLGYIGTICRPDQNDVEYSEMEVRALTGAGAAPALPPEVRGGPASTARTARLRWGRRVPE